MVHHISQLLTSSHNKRMVLHHNRTMVRRRNRTMVPRRNRALVLNNRMAYQFSSHNLLTDCHLHQFASQFLQAMGHRHSAHIQNLIMAQVVMDGNPFQGLPSEVKPLQTVTLHQFNQYCQKILTCPLLLHWTLYTWLILRFKCNRFHQIFNCQWPNRRISMAMHTISVQTLRQA